MKTPTSACLSALILYAFPIFAADGDLKSALDAMRQRHREALAAATAAATAAVEDEWYLGLKKLRLEAVAKNDGETTKKIEAMLLAAGRNGVKLPDPAASAASPTEEKKMGLPEKGTRWDGRLTTYATTEPKQSYLSVKSSITSADEESFVLKISHDDGAVWEWTLRHTGGEIEVMSFNRIRAADWNKQAKPGPVLGITGGGRMGDGVMSFNYRWPGSEQQWTGTYALKLVK